MKIFGYEFRREEKAAQFETVLQRLLAAREGLLSWGITPANAMASPTVHAIVTAIFNRLSVTPVHVYRRVTRNGRESKERLPSHPLAKLLEEKGQVRVQCVQALDQQAAPALRAGMQSRRDFALLVRDRSRPSWVG